MGAPSSPITLFLLPTNRSHAPSTEHARVRRVRLALHAKLSEETRALRAFSCDLHRFTQTCALLRAHSTPILLTSFRRHALAFRPPPPFRRQMAAPFACSASASKTLPAATLFKGIKGRKESSSLAASRAKYCASAGRNVGALVVRIWGKGGVEEGAR